MNDFEHDPIETDRDFVSPEEEASVPASEDSPNKAIVTAVVGAVVTILAALGVEIEPEVAAAVVTLIATLLVYVVPNRPVA